MSDDKGGRELTPRDPDEIETTDSSVTPIPDGDSREVERFSSGPRAHSVSLTEERSAQIVRQSANARNVVTGANALGIIDEALAEVQLQAGGFNAEFGGANAGIIIHQLRTGIWNLLEQTTLRDLVRRPAPAPIVR